VSSLVVINVAMAAAQAASGWPHPAARRPGLGTGPWQLTRGGRRPGSPPAMISAVPARLTRWG